MLTPRTWFRLQKKTVEPLNSIAHNKFRVSTDKFVNHRYCRNTADNYCFFFVRSIQVFFANVVYIFFCAGVRIE